LAADDASVVLGSRSAGIVEGAHLRDRGDHADGDRLLGEGRLPVVEIDRVLRAHHHVRTAARGDDRAGGAAPEATVASETRPPSRISSKPYTAAARARCASIQERNQALQLLLGVQTQLGLAPLGSGVGAPFVLAARRRRRCRSHR
jgi:hypothetical protein